MCYAADQLAETTPAAEATEVIAEPPDRTIIMGGVARPDLKYPTRRQTT
jgi:hypothetical protein